MSTFQTQFANTPLQWNTAGVYPAVPPPPPYYFPYHGYPDFANMGRKKGGASYAPNYPDDWTPPATKRPQRFAKLSQSQSPQRKDEHGNEQSSSQQHQQPAQLPYQQQIPSSCQQQTQPPNHLQQSQWAPQSLWSANQAPPTAPHLRPNAAVFQPGQSRYNLRSRHTSTVASNPDSIVQSIETDDTIQQLSTRFTGSSQRDTTRRSTPRRGPTPINTDIEPVVVPEVSQKYLEIARSEPRRLLEPQKLLVLLDLNGTLVYRSGPFRKVVTKRPGVEALISYLFANHHVMVFTSATQGSAAKMANVLFTPQQSSQLVAIRTREHLNLTAEQFRNKVQVYKDLNMIWEDPEIRAAGLKAGTRWDMTNTVLIDDSIIKAKSHPHNLLQVSEFQELDHDVSAVKKAARTRLIQEQTEIMASVVKKLDELKWQLNVACLLRQWQEGETASPERSDNDEQLAQRALAVAKAKAQEYLRARKAYPTPESFDGAAEERGQKVTVEADEDEDEYDPDVWQGVKLPTPTLSETESLARPPPQDAITTIVASGKVVRSPSPVTEDHFKWLSLDDGLIHSGKA